MTWINIYIRLLSGSPTYTWIHAVRCSLLLLTYVVPHNITTDFTDSEQKASYYSTSRIDSATALEVKTTL